jgi:hypothetical protein
VRHKKWESVETRFAQTTTLSYPFSVKHKLHRLKRGHVKGKVKNNGLQLLLEKRRSFGTDCFDVAVVFDFHPLLTLPIVQDRKWIKKASLFERSEFRSFPIFCPA